MEGDELSRGAADEGRAFLAALRSAARRTPDGAIALVTGIGLTGVTVIALFAHAYWQPGLVFVLMLSFGGWGMADRSAPSPRWIATAAKLLAVSGGMLATLVLLFNAISFALGNLRP